jgi:RNA polymerase sigma-70 factor (ECF subfamily)
MAIWKQWSTLNKNTNSWPNYLYRVTVRKTLELARKKRLTSSLVPDIIDPDDGPVDQAASAELQTRLRTCLTKVSDKQAEVFSLSCFQGLSNNEIGTILNCSQGTVRVHLHRAVKRLTELMQDFL